MKLYEIDRAIEDLIADSIDPETGELLIDPAALEALQMDRETAIENMAAAWKDITGDVEKIKAEEAQLAERRKTLERRAARLKDYISDALAGEALKSPRVAVSWKASTAVEIDEDTFSHCVPADSIFWRHKPPEVNKKAVTDALKAGQDVPGAALVQRNNMSIK